MSAMVKRVSPVGPEAPAARWYGVYPALVSDVADPEALGRVKVQLQWSVDQGGPSPAQKESMVEAWARLATLGAGNDRGVWIRPEVGDEVLVAFEAGDAARPYVVGTLWNGEDRPPSGVDNSSDNNVKLIKTRGGSNIFIDDTAGRERLELHTPGGCNVKLSDADTGALEIADSHGNKVLLTASGIEIQSTSEVVISSTSSLRVDAPSVNVQSATATFSGIVNCNTLIANSVVASSYTPGAGNIW